MRPDCELRLKIKRAELAPFVGVEMSISDVGEAKHPQIMADKSSSE